MIQLQLFRYPVIVEPMALVITAIMAAQYSGAEVSANGLAQIVATMVVIMVSILFHELGHAWVGDAVGMQTTHIVLHGMGGSCGHRVDVAPGKRLLMILAGPGFGFLLGGFALGALMLVPPEVPPQLSALLSVAATINIVWSIFNLFPLFPLDGGQALYAILRLRLSTGRSFAISRWSGLVVGGMLVLYGLQSGQRFLAFFGAYAMYLNWNRR